MTVVRTVKDCVGFELRIALGSDKPQNNRALEDIEDDIQVLVYDGLKQYELYKRWSGGDLYFCRKFFWVDGNRELLVQVFNQGREDTKERLVLYIAESHSQELLQEVRELLDRVELGDPGTLGHQVVENLHIFQKFQASYGNVGTELIAHFLQESESLRQRKALRLIMHFKERFMLEPLVSLLKTTTDEMLVKELEDLFSQWPHPAEIYRLIDGMYKNNPQSPNLRCKALMVLGGLETPAARETLENAAKFDPDTTARGKAQEILQRKG